MAYHPHTGLHYS